MDGITPKRQKDVDVDISRIEKREGRLRSSFEAQGGMSGETMQAILAFFTEYPKRPRPHLFLLVIERIKEMHLLSLPEHRYGVAGAMAAVYHLHPEHEDAWKNAEGQVLEVAENLAPPFTDEEIERPTHVDYLWMTWLVTADDAAWQRVYRLAHRTDEVGVHARTILHVNQTLPQVQAALEQLRLRGAAGVQVVGGKGEQAPPVADVQALAQLLVEVPSNRKKVVLVGWMLTPTPAFQVVTPDGTKPSNCPDTWKGLPVLLREATADEMRQHQILSLTEDDL